MTELKSPIAGMTPGPRSSSSSFHGSSPACSASALEPKTAPLDQLRRRSQQPRAFRLEQVQATDVVAGHRPKGQGPDSVQ